jgi:carbamoyl-phosphate synthase large subunit
MQKALRGLETGLTGFNEIEIDGVVDVEDEAGARAAVVRALGQPTPDRILVIAQAFRHGLSVEEVNAACSYEPWFLRQIADIVREEGHIRVKGLPGADLLKALPLDGGGLGGGGAPSLPLRSAEGAGASCAKPSDTLTPPHPRPFPVEGKGEGL